MNRARLVGVLAALTVAATACTGGGDVLDGDDASTPTDAPIGVFETVESTPEVELRDGQTLHTVGVVFQYGQFEVTVGDVVYDANTQELLLGLRFRNLSDAWAMPETQAELRVGSETHPVFGTVVDIPPRLSADVTWTVGPLEEDPVPDGELVWGRPDRDQPIVHLGGGGENLWRPVAFEADGWAGIGKYSVHLTGGQVLAASPGFGAQPPPGERVLRLVFDTYAHVVDPVNGFYPLEHLRLVRPDGETVEGVASSPGFAPVAWSATGGNTIDFPVPADFAGDYVVELSSLSTKGFSTLHPELIERVPIAFTVPDVDPPSTEAPEPRPVPDLSSASGEPSDSAPIDMQIDAGTVNVGGFLFTPNRLRWDPAERTAELDGEVVSIETVTPSDMEDLVGGLLDVPPQFSFTSALVSAGRYSTGIITSSFVDAETPTTVTIEFLGVDSLDSDDIGLVIGPREGAASSLPLTPESAVPSYPPTPVVDRIEADPVTAGDWTIQLEGYRVGLLRGTTPPPPGMLDLEVFFSMTASPGAAVRSLGLSFRPSVQVFIAQPDGYMQQPVADSGLVFYEPGETKRQSVTFHVPDSFAPGTYSFVLRSADESTEVTIDSFVETTFRAVLTDTRAEEDPGGL